MVCIVTITYIIYNKIIKYLSLRVVKEFLKSDYRLMKRLKPYQGWIQHEIMGGLKA